MRTATYCTISDVQNRLSATGVTLRTDDSPPDDYGNVLDHAAAIIDEHCLLTYSEAGLQDSRWVHHAAADLATYLLCERRGNPAPASIARRYERLLERLEQVRIGRFQIPDIGARRAAAPAMSNLGVQMRPALHPRVQRDRSTGPSATDYPQRTDRYDPLSYVPDYAI